MSRRPPKPTPAPEASRRALEESTVELRVPPHAPNRHRGRASDPIFGFLLAVAVSIGLTPVLPAQADLRYTLAWGVLAAVGVLAWLFGDLERIGREAPDDVAWGIGFGLMVSVPFALFFTPQFETATRLMFPQGLDPITQQMRPLGAGTVLAYFVFVMPLAETLFFRGLLQRQLEFYIVGGLGSIWNLVLFFPVMWTEILAAPAVAVVLAIALIGMNMIVAYVCDRNGLAAAWVCQIVAVLVLFFIPFI